jgi:hypothetical protein
MFPRTILSLLLSITLSPALHAREKEAAPPVQFRAVLHAPVQPIANLYYPDKTGTLLPLNFRPQDLTEMLSTIPVNGIIRLYDKAFIDPENPDANLAASLTLPRGMSRLIMIVIPTPTRSKPAYRMILIDDSDQAFPQGASKILSLVAVDIAIEAGEHKQMVRAGKISSLPPVTSVNDFHMAQTNFHYRHKDSWVAFTERQLHYIDATRRLFIIHATPGALQPTVTTIVDTNTKF